MRKLREKQKIEAWSVCAAWAFLQCRTERAASLRKTG